MTDTLDKLPAEEAERTVTLTVRAPLSLAAETDRVIREDGGTVSEFIREAMNEKLSRRARRKARAVAGGLAE
jgi:metal-responsive CopG/Arc/MetJ family transcriptional regulator